MAINETDLTEATATLLAARAAKAELDQELKEAKEFITEQENLIIHLMQTMGLTSYSNGEVNISMRMSQKPTLINYDELLDYIINNGAYDLLQKRISSTAVQERWQDGQEVPGVGSYDDVSITVRSK